MSNMPHTYRERRLDAVNTMSTRGKDTKTAFYKWFNQLETKRASDNHNMLNLFDRLQRQISALHTAVASSLKT